MCVESVGILLIGRVINFRLFFISNILPMLSLKQELETRGLLKQFSNEELFGLYDKGGQVFYIGMDPSADSLTIGNFAMFMTCLQFMKR